MKALLSGKILAVALVAIVLTACGGSDSNGRKSSSSSVPSSAAASSVAPSSVAASSVAPSSVAASSVAASEVASSVASSEAAPAMVIYEDEEIPAWNLWDCCGGTTPVVVAAAEVEHGNVAQFTINNGPDGGSVVGFTARNGGNDGAEGGAPFNATSIKTTGTLTFDLKMTQAPTPGVGVWLLKVESSSGPITFAEVNLSSSHEGHTAPVLNTWQTYTFNISALETDGLDVSRMEVFMIFPAWSTGQGAIFQVDNVKILATGATP
jgi:hypothetical protein